VTAKRRPYVSAPCPVCAESGGFHDDEVHAQARADIPKRLLRPPGTVIREAERVEREERYRRWLEGPSLDAYPVPAEVEQVGDGRTVA
jgi:hypothetical protein